MNTFVDPNQLESFFNARPSEPPYFLFAAGLFICLTSGLAFAASVRAEMGRWYKNPNMEYGSRWMRLQVAFPFAGLVLGLGIGFAAALMSIGVSTVFAWAIALLLTPVVGGLIWSRIGKQMGQEALDFYIDQQMHQQS
ncbi:hypothetical protein [Leptolyngbya ohadii]|uniref:hypothetical protein n=1 Tax=Leptolyngbya ohadii TaxID=1962290 RepID=UPI000B5A1AE9|nr:hypothetical protein [Leptolyngbya ohadii]